MMSRREKHMNFILRENTIWFHVQKLTIKAILPYVEIVPST